MELMEADFEYSSVQI